MLDASVAGGDLLFLVDDSMKACAFEQLLTRSKKIYSNNPNLQGALTKVGHVANLSS